jgi:hypothetical protein
MPIVDSFNAPRSPAGSGRCSASGITAGVQRGELVEDEPGVATRTSTAPAATSGVRGGMAGTSTRPSGNST